MKGQKKYTLREIKAMVSHTTNIALPTAKALRESGEPLVSCIINTSRVSVYSSGFALYETDMGVTVFRVEDCGAYVYHSVEEEEQFMSEETFSDEEWTVRFILEGEDRLWRNQQLVHNNKHGTKLELNEEREEAFIDHEQSLDNTIEKIVSQDKCRRLLSCLTDKQRRIVEAYYIFDLTQQEIADQLHISHQVVDRTLKAAIRKMQKNF